MKAFFLKWIFFKKKRIIFGLSFNCIMLLIVFLSSFNSNQLYFVEFQNYLQYTPPQENGILSAIQTTSVLSTKVDSIDTSISPTLDDISLEYYHFYLKSNYNINDLSLSINISVRTLKNSTLALIFLPSFILPANNSLFEINNNTLLNIQNKHIQILNDTNYSYIKNYLKDLGFIINDRYIILNNGEENISQIFYDSNNIDIIDYFKFNYEKNFECNKILSSPNLNTDPIFYSTSKYSIEFLKEPEIMAQLFKAQDIQHEFRLYLILLPLYGIIICIYFYYSKLFKNFLEDNKILEVAGKEQSMLLVIILEFFLINFPFFSFIILDTDNFFVNIFIVIILLVFGINLLIYFYNKNNIKLPNFILILTFTIIISSIFGIYFTITFSSMTDLLIIFSASITVFLILLIYSFLFKSLIARFHFRSLKLNHYTFSLKTFSVLIIVLFLFNSFFFTNFINEEKFKEEKVFNANFICNVNENCLKYIIINGSSSNVPINIVLTDFNKFSQIFNNYEFLDFKIPNFDKNLNNSIINYDLISKLSWNLNIERNLKLILYNRSILVNTIPIYSLDNLPGLPRLKNWILIDINQITKIDLNNASIGYFQEKSLVLLDNILSFTTISADRPDFSIGIVIYPIVILFYIIIYVISLKIGQNDIKEFKTNLLNVEKALNLIQNTNFSLNFSHFSQIINFVILLNFLFVSSCFMLLFSSIYLLSININLIFINFIFYYVVFYLIEFLFLYIIFLMVTK